MVVFLLIVLLLVLILLVLSSLLLLLLTVVFLILSSFRLSDVVVFTTGSRRHWDVLLGFIKLGVFRVASYHTVSSADY